jgi:tetratricopeptide (TPR) repeat protein
MLETIREYGLEQLAASGEVAAVRRRYALHYLALAEEEEPALKGADQSRSLARLEREDDNLRATLRWACEGGESEIGLRVAGALSRFWYLRGDLSEGLGWLEYLLAQADNGIDTAASTVTLEGAPDAPPGAAMSALRAKALNAAGSLAWNRGDTQRAAVWHAECLALRRRAGDRPGIASSLNNLGIVAGLQGDYARATALFEESLALYRDLGDTWGVDSALGNLGLVAMYQGDYAQAAVLHAESLALSRDLGDTAKIALKLTNLGEVARLQGQYARATALHEESLALAREVGDKRGSALALENLGSVAYAQGAHGHALALYRESLELFHMVGDKEGVARHLEGVATVAGARDAPVLATRLFGAAAAVRNAIGAPLPPAYRAHYDGTTAALCATLGEDAYEAAWAEGWALPLEQAIAAALGEADAPVGPGPAPTAAGA